MVYVYNEQLFSYEEVWNADTRCMRPENIMLSDKHYAEPDTKGQKFLRFHLLHLREISRIVRFIETARRLEVTTGWERWGINYCLTGTELLFGVIQNFGNSGDGYPTLHTWCCWTVHFKMVIKGKFYSVYILPQSKMVLKKERWENKENCFDNCIP